MKSASKKYNPPDLVTVLEKSERPIRRSLYSAIRHHEFLRLAKGLFVYWRTGVTPTWAHQTLVNVYCKTQGVSNDFLHGLIRLLRPKYSFPNVPGTLPSFSARDLKTIDSQLRAKG